MFCVSFSPTATGRVGVQRERRGGERRTTYFDMAERERWGFSGCVVLAFACERLRLRLRLGEVECWRLWLWLWWYRDGFACALGRSLAMGVLSRYDDTYAGLPHRLGC